MKRSVLICLVIMFCSAIPAVAAAPTKTYKYVIWNMMGNESTQYVDMIRKIVNLMFDKMGEKVTITEMSQKDAYKGIEKKTIDFTTMLQSDYVEMVNRGVEVFPVLTVAPLGKVKEYKCLVMSKKVEYKKVGDLKGLKFAQTDTLGDYIGNRWFFGTTGIDEPLDKFFGDILMVKDDAIALQSLSEGKVDVGFIAAGTINFAKFANSGLFKNLKQGECKEHPWPGAPVVWVGKPDPAAMKKLYETMSKLETFPEFKQLKPLLTALKLRINFVNERDYESLVKTYGQAKKSGWLKEFERIRAGK